MWGQPPSAVRAERSSALLFAATFLTLPSPAPAAYIGSSAWLGWGSR